MATPFLNRKRDLILLQWASFALAAVLLLFGRIPGWGWDLLLLIPLLAWPLVFTLYTPLILDTAGRLYFFVLVNVAVPNLIPAFAGVDFIRFSIPFFAALIVCAVAAGFRRVLLLCCPVVLAFPAASFLQQGTVGPTEWLATGLLAASALLFAFIAQLERTHRARTETDSTFTLELFELGQLLARVEDSDLIQRIPRSISQIMRADICELTEIEDWRIVRRILPNRHCRDFDNIEIRKSVHERALGSSDTCVTADLQEDPWFRQKEDFALYPYGSYMARAWFSEGRPAGLLAVYREKKTTWTEQEMKKFAFLVDQSSLALQNARLRKELKDQATSDGLTGMPNHRSFYERIEGEFARHERQNRNFAIMIIDLDFFKKINDTAGHKVGDQVLQQIPDLLKNNTRRGDIPGRLGGDEFALALPETSIEDACAIGERIIQGARKTRVAHFTGFSLSIGCAVFPQDGTTLPEILEHADQALYLSKRLGRGRLSRYSDVTAPDEQASATTPLRGLEN